MGIDGIGKRGGIPPSVPAPGTAPAPGSSFAVGAPASPSEVSGAPGTDAFSALERGELSVDEYLDARVESAVAPLVSRLSPEQLEFVRSELRSSLSTDPVLVELVRKTTSGVTPRE